jgi:Skp family chaperone for outer membrane proteins
VTKSQREVDQRKKELETAALLYQRQKPMLSEEAQREKERELQKQQMEFQLWGQERQRSLERKRDEMMQQIWSRVGELAAKIAKEKRLSMVVDYNPKPPTAIANFEKGFVYLAPEMDITDELIKRFNALFKRGS